MYHDYPLRQSFTALEKTIEMFLDFEEVETTRIETALSCSLIWWHWLLIKETELKCNSFQKLNWESLYEYIYIYVTQFQLSKRFAYWQ